MEDISKFLTNPTLNWSLYTIINAMMVANVLVGTLHARLKNEYKGWYFKEHVEKKILYSLVLLVSLVVAHDTQTHALGSVLTGFFIKIEWKSFKKHFIEYNEEKKDNGGEKKEEVQDFDSII